jgi:hypothetical protein
LEIVYSANNGIEGSTPSLSAILLAMISEYGSSECEHQVKVDGKDSPNSERMIPNCT